MFLCRDRDIDWLFSENGAARIRPQEYKKLLDSLSVQLGDDIFQALAKKWNISNLEQRVQIAKNWSSWETSLCHINYKETDHYFDPQSALEYCVLEHHYLSQRGFIKEDQILDNIKSIKHLPAYIVHGRHDLCCPVDQSLQLTSNWGEEAYLTIAENSSHSETSQEIIDILKDLTNSVIN